MPYNEYTRTRGATTGLDTGSKSPRKANKLDPAPSPSPTPEEKDPAKGIANKGQKKQLRDLENSGD